MSSAPKVLSLRLIVRMEDGSEYVTQTANPDMLRWDKTRPGKHWPTFQDAPFLGMTFLAWAALTRQGQIEMPWDEFEKQCMMCGEAGSDAVDPTQEAVGADS